MLNSDYIDVRAGWTRNREISKGGVLLVRPDRYVGWQSIEAVPDPKRALRSARIKILSRPESSRCE